MTIQFERAIPIFRIFSLEKAREFYVDFLGCKVDWEAPFRARLAGLHAGFARRALSFISANITATVRRAPTPMSSPTACGTCTAN